MCVKKIISLILGLSFSCSLFAEGDLLTLDEAVKEVLSQNPEIQAAHDQMDAARARIPQAKALEDPLVGVEFYDVPINTFDPKQGMEINYQIEQKIPFPGKRHTRGKVARHDARAVEEESQGKIGDILLDLKTTYYTLYRLDRSLEVIQGSEKLLQQLAGSTETWYATGKTTADTPLKAQVELSKLQNEKIQLQQERVTHLAHLKALLNRTTHHEIQIPSTLPWPHLQASLEEVTESALEKRPEIRSLEEQKNRDRSKWTVARENLIPDFSLGFQYNQRPNQRDAWTGSAMVNLPIFFWGKNRGELQEAKATYKASESEFNAMKLHTRHEIEGAYSAVKTTEQLIDSFQKRLLPQSKTTLEAARLAYASTKIDFMTLIDAERTYKDLQIAYYESQARLGTAFAQLERLVGKNLEEL